MVTTRPIAIGILFLSLSASVRLSAQSSGPNMSFVIDPNRHYVYLKFDHIGPGIPRDEEEPKTRIWLRLINNCRVPIVVLENGSPEGSPKDERQIMLEVVPTPMPDQGLVLFSSTAEGANPKPLQPEQSSASSAKMPRGYSSDVGSSESIPPGKGILFSIPVNFLNKRWHVEIPYTFDLPPGKCCRDTDIGGEPRMVIAYLLWHLPPKFLSQVSKD